MHRKTWPNFFIVGAAKAGTTSLHTYLGQHPEIFMPQRKEPFYFSQVEPIPEFRHMMLPVITNEDEYLSLFHTNKHVVAMGESSPAYLWDPLCPSRIHGKLPDAKIIIILRDPVQRAYSQYLMNVREGVELLSMYDSLIADSKRFPKKYAATCMYVELGLYAEQVERYFNTFGRDKVKILMFDDLMRQPRYLLEDVASFLGADPSKVDCIRTDVVHNQYMVHRSRMATSLMRAARHYVRFTRPLLPQAFRTWFRYTFLLAKGKKPPIDANTAEYLDNIFADDLGRLEMLLGYPVPSLRPKKADGEGRTLSNDNVAVGTIV